MMEIFHDRLKIKSISARQIFDSRGNPTVEAQVRLEGGTAACAAVPSGASTGKYEACELRDHNFDSYRGKSVFKAVSNINNDIAGALCGHYADDQTEIDHTMCELDGTENKSALGANAILAVSLACAKAAARAYSMPLYRYIGGVNATELPCPMMNILNGGAHAENNIDIQEFMIMPIGAKSFAEAMKIGTEIYGSLGDLLKGKNLSTTVGDEGGYAPNLECDEAALQLLTDAIEKAGYRPGAQVSIALDAATSDWIESGTYLFPKKQIRKTRGEMIEYFNSLAEKYPIISIEDPLTEEDFDGFAEICAKMKHMQIVGDDLFVTNPERLTKGILLHSANAILIKPNQIGTLTETLEAISLAKKHGYRTIISHRSGETEDTTIADLAVATNAGQIKTGAPARSERVCKYNRLLRIECCLGRAAKMSSLPHRATTV